MTNNEMASCLIALRDSREPQLSAKDIESLNYAIELIKKEEHKVINRIVYNSLYVQFKDIEKVSAIVKPVSGNDYRTEDFTYVCNNIPLDTFEIKALKDLNVSNFDMERIDYKVVTPDEIVNFHFESKEVPLIWMYYLYRLGIKFELEWNREYDIDGITHGLILNSMDSDDGFTIEVD